MAQDLAAGIHEHHALRDLAGKAHLVGHHHHRHALLRDSDHDIGSSADVGSS
ncbi:hypothetical protein [Rhizobium leguminosarum]|uniref:hypothetical protein n=1 Tax=Rhizobium leguminosarum TaxID=384 RepID=UPI001C9871B9|nr:hypothetical protein [Rhizobium leguminosarum]